MLPDEVEHGPDPLFQGTQPGKLRHLLGPRRRDLPPALDQLLVKRLPVGEEVVEAALADPDAPAERIDLHSADPPDPQKLQSSIQPVVRLEQLHCTHRSHPYYCVYFCTV